MSLPPLQQEAARELLRRRKARASLLNFTCATFPQYQADPAHCLIADHLDAVVRGELTRLMIFAPPQHGKSELVSVRLPAFWMGHWPDAPVILASYAASLAESKSRQARSVVESSDYRRLFLNVRTRRDSRAVNHWTLEGRRGGMLAAGVGGPVTGHGAQLAIVDDPTSNWQDAQSQTIRDTAWDWYRSTFRTRVWEGGAIVLIQTRWHEDDLAGRLLAEQAREWKVLRLPALAETQEERDSANERLGLPLGQPDPLGRGPGEPLCPGRFSREALDQLRRDVGSLSWFAQYQGTPRSTEGNRFKRSWFQVQDAGPAQVTARCRYWDLAATEDGGDYTAGVLMARTGQGLYVVEDVVRGRWSPGKRNEVLLQTAATDESRHGKGVQIWVEQEPGSSGVESAEAIVRLLAGYRIQAERVTGDKETRAEPLAAQAEAGNVRLVRGAWNGNWVEELCSFPNGRNDDMVDATSGAFNKLAKPLRQLVIGM
jgi:predicted phage terminase large subunit-like protein